MTDNTEIAELTPEDEDWSWAEARKKLTPKLDNRRKKRQKRLADSVDRRSLRASGRTEQFNFKSTPGLKARAQEAAVRKGITLAEWMERAVEAALIVPKVTEIA
jgi:predicted HicB family RNase H-like nuclease